MAEPENQTLHILRELREALKSLDIKVDRGFAEMKSRMDNIRQALNGESVLGRYAAAEDRLEAIEKRLDDLEKT